MHYQKQNVPYAAYTRLEFSTTNVQCDEKGGGKGTVADADPITFPPPRINGLSRYLKRNDIHIEI